VSVEATGAAIASQWQGKHEAFNAALYAGAGEARFPRDPDGRKSGGRELADRIGTGWPALTSGTEAQGYLPVSKLLKVASASAAG